MSANQHRLSLPLGTEPWGRRLLQILFSLRCKATATLALAILFLTVGVATHFLHSTVRIMAGFQARQLESWALVLAEFSREPIAEANQDTLRELASTFAASTPLLYVTVTDARGTPLVEVRGIRHDALMLPERDWNRTEHLLGVPRHVSGTSRTPPIVDIVVPISRRISSATADGSGRAELLGYLWTGLAEDPWLRASLGSFDVFVGKMVLGTLIVIPLSYLMVRGVARPIERLTETVMRFSGGDLSARSSIIRSDEIGRLASAFNSMAEEHQHTHERLVRLNAELEARVAHRTAQLRELASRDPLTGLYNRRYLLEMLHHHRSEAARYHSDLACAMVDLDDFKTVNDRLGHQAGDEVLILAANTIMEELRAADVAARYGGDEFVLLLPRTNREQARNLCRRIQDQFQEAVGRLYPDLSIGISMGISDVQSDPSAGEDGLVRAADRALYEAKTTGKNGIGGVVPRMRRLEMATASRDI